MAGETELSKILASLTPQLKDEEFVFCTMQIAKYGDFTEL